AIAQTLEITESGPLSPAELLRRFLQSRQALLVLDNFEHLLEAAGSVVELLSACPLVKALVTSRSVLKVRGEYEYMVEPLALPRGGDVSFEAVSASPAVALFVERARAVRPDFALTVKNAACVAEICSRLDGLPLAIELAAARVKLLAPEGLVKRLEHRLEVLTGGSRDMPARQRTLRETIDWSYDLLSDWERRLFCRLSVFSGSFSLEAAEKVCADSEASFFSVLDGISSLADKSLICEQTGHKVSGQIRFCMLETIREYADEQVRTSGKYYEVLERHAEFFLDLAKRIEPDLEEVNVASGLDVAEAEIANFRCAMSFFQSMEVRDSALRIAAALRRFWALRGSVSEGRTWLDTEQATLRTEGLARALVAAAQLAAKQRCYGEAEGMLARAFDVCRELGDLAGESIATRIRGSVLLRMGNFEAAGVLFQRCVSHSVAEGNLPQAAVSLSDLGTARYLCGDVLRASLCFLDSLRFSRRVGARYTTMTAANGIGLALLRFGDLRRAASWMHRSVRLCLDMSIEVMGHHLVESVAQLLCSAKHYSRSATLAAASDQLMHRIGVIDAPQSEWDSSGPGLLSVARRELVAEEFAHAVEAGHRLGGRDALLLALREAEQIAREAPRIKNSRTRIEGSVIEK
ncbi:MAG TPA: hypothetical protein VEZ90_05330, partial [Blastocatellia bacterium]|nr:hypothetical protein [Blastocatellia bacterium]